MTMAGLCHQATCWRRRRRRGRHRTSVAEVLAGGRATARCRWRTADAGSRSRCCRRPAAWAGGTRTERSSTSMSRLWTGDSRVNRCCSGGMTTLKPSVHRGRPTPSTAGNRLENVVGSKTAKQFEPLKVFTVGDLMRHVPAALLRTELSDLALLQEVRSSGHGGGRGRRTFNLPDRPNYRLPSKPRLEPPLPIIEEPDLHLLGQPRLISYWKGQLGRGARASSRAK